MYIPDEEYYELKRKVEDLNKIIDHVNKPMNFASLVNEKPYYYITSVNNEDAIFIARQSASCDAWQLFSRLGKLIHQNKSFFRPDKDITFGQLPYMRKISIDKHPRRIDEMSDEQIILSAEMIEEMVNIYNKYFIMANRYVYLDLFRTGKFDKVDITYKELINP